MADIIQQRRDTAARWAQYNPILMEGEVGYVTDNPNQYKIGNGRDKWNDLPLRGYNGTITQEKGNDENAVMSQAAVTKELSELGSEINLKENSYVDSNAGFNIERIGIIGGAYTDGVWKLAVYPGDRLHFQIKLNEVIVSVGSIDYINNGNDTATVNNRVIYTSGYNEHNIKSVIELSSNIIKLGSVKLNNKCFTYQDGLYQYKEDSDKDRNIIDKNINIILAKTNIGSIFAESANGDKIATIDKAIKKLYIKLKTDEYNRNSIRLGSLRKNYGEYNAWSINFYDNKSDYTHSFGFVSQQKKNLVEYLEIDNDNVSAKIVIDWNKLPDGEYLGAISDQYLINYDYVSNSEYLFFDISDVKDNTNQIDYSCDISWVDDDFSIKSVSTVKSICDNLGCKCDFAVIPQAHSASSDEYPTDSIYSFGEEQLSKMKEFELEGFHMEMHPPHKGWYNSSGAGTYQGRAWVEQSLVKTLRCFNEHGILHSNCIIYPGSSSSYNDCVDAVKAWLDFGVESGGTYNIDNEKYKLQRLFIDLNSSKTKTYYKNKIKEGYDKGAWIIIGTHSYEWISDTETIDETTKSIPNLTELIEYANSLHIIRPIRQVAKSRGLI